MLWKEPCEGGGTAGWATRQAEAVRGSQGRGGGGSAISLPGFFFFSRILTRDVKCVVLGRHVTLDPRPIMGLGRARHGPTQCRAVPGPGLRRKPQARSRPLALVHEGQGRAWAQALQGPAMAKQETHDGPNRRPVTCRTLGPRRAHWTKWNRLMLHPFF